MDILTIGLIKKEGRRTEVSLASGAHVSQIVLSHVVD